jgi:hypothetical protein
MQFATRWWKEEESEYAVTVYLGPRNSDDLMILKEIYPHRIKIQQPSVNTMKRDEWTSLNMNFLNEYTAVIYNTC